MRYTLLNPRARVAAVITILLAVALSIALNVGAVGHSVTKITFTPSTPNVLVHGDKVTINFSYKTTLPAGVRIFARPFTGGSPTPGYGASGAGISPTGSGTGTQWFTISSGGTVTVDQVRIQMWNPPQTVMLFEAFVPVHYEYRAP